MKFSTRGHERVAMQDDDASAELASVTFQAFAQINLFAGKEGLVESANFAKCADSRRDSTW